MSTPHHDEKTILIALPPELLCEILKYLDWKGLLAVRLACTRFYSTTKTYDLWLPFVKELESRPGYSRTEKPHEECTAEELERWVLRRYRVDQFWKGTSSALPHPRIVTNSPGISCPQLLPGGRWMLGMCNGAIYAFDLEGSGPQGVKIIDPFYYDDAEPPERANVFNGWQYWVDTGNPRFLLCVAIWASLSVDRTRKEIYFYDVQLSQSGLELVAEKASTVRCTHDEGGHHFTAALDGKHCVELRRGTWVDPTVWVHSYKYQGQHLPTTDLKPTTVRIRDPGQLWVTCHILWDDRLLLINKTFFEIYSLVQLESGPGGQLVAPLFHINLPARATNISAPIFLQNTARCIFACKDAIIGIHLPHDIFIRPQFLELGDQLDSAWYDGSKAGYRSSLFRLGDLNIELTRHIWDDPPSCSPKMCPREWEGKRMLGYSEELGRVVLDDGLPGRIMIYDVAL